MVVLDDDLDALLHFGQHRVEVAGELRFGHADRAHGSMTACAALAPLPRRYFASSTGSE
jgi:hypothetical protein